MTRIPAPTACRAPLALLLLLAAVGLPAQDNLTELSESLIRMRGEVEELNRELDLGREEQRVTLAGLNGQRAELQASLQRQELALREQQELLQQAIERAGEAGVEGDALKPALFAAIDGLEAQIATGLPFRTEDRLAELAGLRDQIQSGVLPAHRAANRLWAFYEDELRISRENGLYAQTIQLGGDRVLADIAKIGSVLLFFRTDDRRVGRAVPAAGGWRFELYEDRADQRRVLELFDALRKQIRQGWFELPGGLRFPEVTP